MYTYIQLVKKLMEYMAEEPFHEKILAEFDRVLKGKFVNLHSTEIKCPTTFKHLHCIPGLNVKSAPFADAEDQSFENDIKVHKDLLGKIPTVADPYIMCPPALRKLMHQYHPRGKM